MNLLGWGASCKYLNFQVEIVVSYQIVKTTINLYLMYKLTLIVTFCMLINLVQAQDKFIVRMDNPQKDSYFAIFKENVDILAYSLTVDEIQELLPIDHANLEPFFGDF